MNRNPTRISEKNCIRSVALQPRTACGELQCNLELARHEETGFREGKYSCSMKDISACSGLPLFLQLPYFAMQDVFNTQNLRLEATVARKKVF